MGRGACEWHLEQRASGNASASSRTVEKPGRNGASPEGISRRHDQVSWQAACQDPKGERNGREQPTVHGHGSENTRVAVPLNQDSLSSDTA